MQSVEGKVVPFDCYSSKEALRPSGGFRGCGLRHEQQYHPRESSAELSRVTMGGEAGHIRTMIMPRVHCGLLGVPHGQRSLALFTVWRCEPWSKHGRAEGRAVVQIDRQTSRQGGRKAGINLGRQHR